MNLEEIKKSDREWLTPREVAKCLGCNPYAISQQAARDASQLGFPVIKIGQRVKIPKRAFIKFMEGELRHEGSR